MSATEPEPDFLEEEDMDAASQGTNLFSQVDDDELNAALDAIGAKSSVEPPTQPVEEDNSKKRKAGSDYLSSTTVVASSPKRFKTTTDNAPMSAELDVGPPLQTTQVKAVTLLPKPFDSASLPFGLTFELARLWDGKHLTEEQLRFLRPKLCASTTNHEALTRLSALLKGDLKDDVKESMRGFQATDPRVWQELDKEATALADNPFAGLGDGQWYGGRVNLRGVLKGGKLHLKPAKLDSSSALKRRFGSWNFLRIEAEDTSTTTLNFLRRPVVIGQHVFRALCAKRGTKSCHVIFVCLDERYVRETDICTKPSTGARGVQYDFLGFVSLLNNLEENKEQYIGKWASRLALFISTSTPGPRLKQDNIFPQNDVFSGRENMTDGCGTANWAFHSLLPPNSNGYPSALQFRLWGSKGMLTLVRADDWYRSPVAKHPALRDWSKSPAAGGEPMVCIRNSQKKIKFPSRRNLDPLHLSTDVCNYAELRVPASLSSEVIINLWSNGVPDQYFVDLATESVKECMQIFTDLKDDEDSLFRIYKAIYDSQGIAAIRQIRSAGFRERKGRQQNEEEDEDFNPIDDLSGCPSSIGETVCELLDAGISLVDCKFARQKTKKVAEKIVEGLQKSQRFPARHSCIGYVVPDPFNVLDEDEIMVTSSTRCFPTPDGFFTNCVRGPVVMTRNPCKLPTDARKLNAVYHDKLADMVDVIICSVKGNRRMLDWLAGGDYDGDRCSVYWEPQIIDNFQNADPSFVNPPPAVERALKKEKTNVGQFMRALDNECKDDKERKIQAIQRHLLASVETFSEVGKISNWHSFLVYTCGYDHPDTILLAHLFARVMDSNKTGETLDANVLKKNLAADHVQWQYVPWDLRDKKKDKSGGYTVNDKKYAVRSKDMPPFIMDVINSAMRKASKEAQKQFDKVLGDAERDDLPAFEAPLKLLRQSVSSKESQVSADRDREILMGHVAEVYQEYTSTIGSSATYQERISHARKRFWTFDTSRLGFVRKNEVSALLASLAAAKNKDFAFQMAFRELCVLQATAATGGWKPVVREFYERFRLKVERVQASPE